MAHRNTRSTLLSKNKSLKKCCYEDFANLETGNRLDWWKNISPKYFANVWMKARYYINLENQFNKWKIFLEWRSVI